MFGLIATVAQLELRLSSKVIAWPRYLLVWVGFRFWSISMYYTFFTSNLIFRLSLELLSEVPKMWLKVAMKLLTFYHDYRLKLTKLGKIEESCYKDFWFEVRQLLAELLWFSKFEARPAKNWVAYKKMCISKDLPNCLKDGNSSMFYWELFGEQKNQIYAFFIRDFHLNPLP